MCVLLIYPLPDTYRHKKTPACEGEGHDTSLRLIYPLANSSSLLLIEKGSKDIGDVTFTVEFH